MDKELVIYSRTTGCPSARVVKRILEKQNVVYREVFIDKDPQAQVRVEVWTGFASVPTLVAARPGEDFPVTEPEPLASGNSPRGVNRGSIISEPTEEQLLVWLRQHQFITKK